MNWGATPEEWKHWSEVLGLTKDLLPVVCKRGATIDPSSKLKDYGKVPSQYRLGAYGVIGIPEWTSKISTPDDITTWERHPDYGICCQTRRVRALDCDLTDPTIARAVRDTIVAFFNHLGVEPPIRARADSTKFLTLFGLEGEYGKRIMKTESGAIEFLGHGQQCLVAGTHKDGARYQWGNELPTIYGLTPEQFEELWSILELTFATEEPTISKIRNRSKRSQQPSSENRVPGDLPTTTMHTDPVTLLLHSKGLVRDTDRDGRVHFWCPWEHEHTSQGDISETTYFPEGTNGYEKGHFLCLHAHCSSRTDADFLDTLGWTLEGFEALAEGSASAREISLASISGGGAADDLIGPAPIVDSPPLGLPPSWMNIKTGTVLGVLPALRHLLRRPDITGLSLSYDRFQEQLFLSVDHSEPSLWTDRGPSFIHERLVRCHRLDPKTTLALIDEACWGIAEENPFDSGLRLADSLPAWDGVPRVKSFYHTYLGVANDPRYAEACSLYLWTALAGRLLSPGIQADMAPIWVGPQGSGKTRAVKALALRPDHYADLDISNPDTDLSRLIRGKCVVELSELRGLRMREIESVKSFISRTFELFIPKYQEAERRFQRRCVMIGTSNREDFLVDDTGNRRFLPINVGPQQDVDAIEMDRGQLWAESLVIYRSEGILWQQAEVLGKDRTDEYMEDDPWQAAIAEWLKSKDLGGRSPSQRVEIDTWDIAKEALHFNTQDLTSVILKRVASSLKKLGWSKRAVRVTGGGWKKVWRPM